MGIVRVRGSLARIFGVAVIAFSAAFGLVAPIQAGQQCQSDAQGRRVPGQWCAGDVFLGIGGLVDQVTTTPTSPACVLQTDSANQPILDPATAMPLYQCPARVNAGTYAQYDALGSPVANAAGISTTLVDAVASGLPLTDAATGAPVTAVQSFDPVTGTNVATEQSSYTTGCALDPVSQDLVTTGFWSNVVSRFSHDSSGPAASGIDLGGLTRIACGSDATAPGDLGRCGAPQSVVFDKAGNFYVGTLKGTGKIVKFDSAGRLLATYTVPVFGQYGHGTNWLDLAADQVTMYYTSGDNRILVFRTDGQALTHSVVKDPATGQLRSLFDAGVEHLADPVLDPGGANNLFGRVLVKLNPDYPDGIGNSTRALRLLPPGDGSGGLLVALDYDVWRIGLDGYLVQSYVENQPLFDFFAVNISPDGQYFWTSNRPRAGHYPSAFLQYHIPSGLLTVGPTVPDGRRAFGMCVVQEYTAGATQPDCGNSASETTDLCRPLAACRTDPSNAQCVPSVAPHITPIPDRTDAEGDTVSVPIVATDESGAGLTYSVNRLPLGLSLNTTVTPPTISGTISYLADDPYGPNPIPIVVTAINRRGFSSSTRFFWTLVEKNGPPTIVSVTPGQRLITPARLDIASAASLNGNVIIRVTDPDACDEPQFFWQSGLPIPGLQLTRIVPEPGSCTEGRVFTGVISGTPSAPSYPATFTFNVRVVDPIGQEVLVPFTWTVNANRPPVVVAPSSQVIHAGTSINLVVNASDPDNPAPPAPPVDIVTVTDLVNGAPTLPPGVTMTAQGVISGAPNVPGSYTTTLTASDQWGAVSAPVTVRWTVNNAPPIVTNPGGQLTVAGVATTLQIVASDSDRDPLTFSDLVNNVHTLPGGLSIDPATGLITGVATKGGPFTVTVSVSDPFGGRAATTFTWQLNVNLPPVCTSAVASRTPLWPPNHRLVPINIVGVTDPDGDAVTIRVTRILQDEPVASGGNDNGNGTGNDNDNGNGNGNNGNGTHGNDDALLDGRGVGTSQARVRAERAAHGDGRVYEIFFSAADGRGGECSGAVMVGVPHDRGSGLVAIDSLIRYDSTIPNGPPLVGR